MSEELLFEPDVHAPEPASRPSSQWRWAVLLLLLGGSIGALLGASRLLMSVTLGTSLHAQSCDPEALPGLGMLILAGLLCGAALQVLRLRDPLLEARWDPASLLVTLPPSLTLALVTLPAVLGCAASSRVAELPLIGSLLIGQGGIALHIASLTLVGLALAGARSVRASATPQGYTAPMLSAIDRMLLEQEHVQAQEQAPRFRGVDPQP